MISEAQMTLIGIIVIQFATGIIANWGTLSLYVLSYYHLHGAPLQIKASTNSLINIISVVSGMAALLVSARIGQKIGYVKLIRICSVLYLIAPLFSFVTFNFIIFLVCYIVIPTASLNLALMPMMNCMYSHNKRSKSCANGLAIASFSLGTVVLNYIVTLTINPDNLIPDVGTADPNLKFFSSEIADRVPRVYNFAYLVSGFLFVMGAFMIHKNERYEEEEFESQSSKYSSSKKEEKNLIQQTEQHDRNTKQVHKKSLQQSRQCQNLHQSQITQKPKQIQNPSPTFPLLTMIQHIKHPVIILLFFLNMFAPLYQNYIVIHAKILYMPIIQNDHMISLSLMLIVMASVIFTTPWGYFSDKKGPALTVLLFIIVDTAVKIYSCYFCVQSNFSFLVSMLLLGVTKKTTMVMFMPIMIDLLGLEMGTKLLPFSVMSSMLSSILASSLGFIFVGIETNSTMRGLCAFSCVNIMLGLVLYWQIQKLRNPKVQDISFKEQKNDNNNNNMI